ncbi:pyroglutamyl-peptidase I [Paenibacillus marinisediminis]
MKTILVTGFDPFGGESLNPSWEAVRRLEGEYEGDYTVAARLLPTSFARAQHLLKQLLTEIEPDYVICVGQAGGRPDLTLERIAINLMEARIADNDGEAPLDTSIAANGPAAYWTSLPIKAMMAAVREAGVPCSISYTAGTFVCNTIFYALMHQLATSPELSGCKGGFIHIPFLPEQALHHPGKASMSLDQIVLGLKAAIAAAALPERSEIAAGILHGE